MISLYIDPEHSTPIPVLYLGEILAPEKMDDLIQGQPFQVFAKNQQGALRELTLFADGDGKENVQLARDEGGAPGVWAAPGESIVIEPGTLFPNAEFSFWARGIYQPDDAEGRKALLLRFRAISVEQQAA